MRAALERLIDLAGRRLEGRLELGPELVGVHGLPRFFDFRSRHNPGIHRLDGVAIPVFLAWVQAVAIGFVEPLASGADFWGAKEQSVALLVGQGGADDLRPHHFSNVRRFVKNSKRDRQAAQAVRHFGAKEADHGAGVLQDN